NSFEAWQERGRLFLSWYVPAAERRRNFIPAGRRISGLGCKRFWSNAVNYHERIIVMLKTKSSAIKKRTPVLNRRVSSGVRVSHTSRVVARHNRPSVKGSR